MRLEFTGEMWHWRGPAPHHFVTVPADDAQRIADIASYVTYGWGMIPVTGRVGATDFTTSLWPKDGGYILPVKLALRRAEDLELGDLIDVELTIDAPG